MKKKFLFHNFFLIFVFGLKEGPKGTSIISSFWKLVNPFPWKPSKMAARGQFSNPIGFFSIKCILNLFFAYVSLDTCLQSYREKNMIFLLGIFLWFFKNVNTQNYVFFRHNHNLFRYYNEIVKSLSVTLWRDI